MPWARVDDKFPDHPKVLDIGPVAEALWLRALCYANRNLTDGVVPCGFVRRMGDLDGPAEAAKLVAAGLWSETEAGYRIHDYHEYQPSKVDVEEVAKVRAEAGRKGGLQKAANAQAAGKQNPDKLPDAGQANVKQNSSPNRTQPEPNRTGPNEEETTRARATPAPPGAAAPSSSEPYRLFQAFCEETGADEAAAGERTKGQQCAVAKRLLADGVDETELRRAVRWLGSQAWRTSPIDLRTVEAEIGKWRLAGRPEREQPAIRGSPNGRASKAETIDANFAEARRLRGMAPPAGDDRAIEVHGRTVS